MNQKATENRLPKLTTIIGSILLGGLIGVLVAVLLYTYLIPLWRHAVIDTKDYTFQDILFVDYHSTENNDLSSDRVVLKTSAEKFYSWHQDQWQLVEAPTPDPTSFSFEYPPCNEWLSPPPGTYLGNMLDNDGIEFEHALGLSSRCYILLADGSLHIWQRDISVFDMMVIGGSGILLGMTLGGVIGKSIAKWSAA